MKNRERRYSKKKLVNITGKMEADMRSYCRDRGIESESELIRQAVAKYIYAGHTGETPDRYALKQIQGMLARCQLSITFK